MKKLTSLSPLEQEIYFAVEHVPHGLVNYETIREITSAKKSVLDVVLWRMCKKGWLKKLRKGLYIVSKPTEEIFIDDSFIAAQEIFSGYISLSSALYVHKLTDQFPFEIYIATVSKSAKRYIGNVSIRAIAFGKRMFGTERKGDYYVSTVPKTLYDCLKHPSFAGGFPQILKAIYEAKMGRQQWQEFLYYVKKFEKSAFYQKLGYLLEILPKKTNEIKKIVILCKEKVKVKTYLYPSKLKGRYIKEWKLIDNIGKDALLAWWYNG